MIKHKILIKANIAVALCLAIFFIGTNQENIIMQATDVITVKDLKIEKAQLDIDFYKQEHERCKDLHGEDHPETRRAELNWKTSVLNLKIIQLEN